MDVVFLGTSASPSMPVPFCTCDVCKTCRRIQGKNLRRRSSILIDGKLIVDLGPDVVSSSFTHGVSLENVCICLQTHSHSDHFDPELIVCRNPEYGNVTKSVLRFVASRQAAEQADIIVNQHCAYGSIFGKNGETAYNILVQAIRPFERVNINEYQVTALQANHGNGEDCFIYAIELANAAILYATDTSNLSDKVWKYLTETEFCFDAVILDHTYGMGFPSIHGDHLGHQDFVDHVRKFRELQLIKKNGRIYATHLSHEGNTEHSELCRIAEKYGYVVAYDGLRFTVK